MSTSTLLLIVSINSLGTLTVVPIRHEVFDTFHHFRSVITRRGEASLLISTLVDTDFLEAFQGVGGSAGTVETVKDEVTDFPIHS